VNKFSRRSFLAGLSAAAPLTFLPKLDGRSQLLNAEAAALPANPSASGIEHVVLVMMENRSFDHFLGWVPNANTRQQNRYPNKSGQMVPTFHLTNFQNCNYADPDHSYAGGRTEFDNGKCDGWLIANGSDNFSIGYYEQSDLAFLGNAARDWTVCDMYFPAVMSSTFPNRLYQHAAQTDRMSNTLTISTLPTIWDRLQAAGRQGRYYFSDVPFLALWGIKYADITRPYAEFLADCAAGSLPEVSFLDPRFIDPTTGTSADDHPHADIRNGEAFLNQIYNAVRTSPNWKNTVLIINFDEWGGFFDHVPPPTAPIPPSDAAAGNLDGRLGFRVPLLVISPWSPRSTVNHTQFDHTSVLKMIEWRWTLPPLSIRDQTANNLATALDFSNPNLATNSYNVPVGPFGKFCLSGIFSNLGLESPSVSPGSNVKQSGDEDLEWAPVLNLARQFGFHVED
jgi:phospholipase C